MSHPHASSMALYQPDPQQNGQCQYSGDYSPRSNPTDTPRESRGGSAPNTHRSGSGSTPRDDRFYTPRSLGCGTPRTARSGSTDNDNAFFSPRSSLGNGGAAGGGPGSEYGTPRSGYQGSRGTGCAASGLGAPPQQSSGLAYASAPTQPSPRLSSLSSGMSPRQQQYQDQQYQQQYQQYQQMQQQEQEQLVQQHLHYQRYHQKGAGSGPGGPQQQHYTHGTGAASDSSYNSPRTHAQSSLQQSPNAPQIQMPAFQSSFQQQLQQQLPPSSHLHGVAYSSNEGSTGYSSGGIAENRGAKMDAKYSPAYSSHGGQGQWAHGTEGISYPIRNDEDYAQHRYESDYKQSQVQTHSQQQQQRRFYEADAKSVGSHYSDFIGSGGQYNVDAKTHGSHSQGQWAATYQVPQYTQEGQRGAVPPYVGESGARDDYKRDFTQPYQYHRQHNQQQQIVSDYCSSDTSSVAASAHTAQSAPSMPYGMHRHQQQQQRHPQNSPQQDQYQLHAGGQYQYQQGYQYQDQQHAASNVGQPMPYDGNRDAYHLHSPHASSQSGQVYSVEYGNFASPGADGELDREAVEARQLDALYAAGLTESDVEDVFSSARHGRVEEIEKLFDRGLPVDVRDEHGNALLTIACQNGNKRVAKACLRRSADINARNYKGNTPLHYCFGYGYGDTLGAYLIEKGADVNAKNNVGKNVYEGI